MKLSQALFSQGFGTRRACAGLVHQGLVAIAGRVCDDPDEVVAPTDLVLTVEGEDWAFHEPALLVLHKPAGFECSQKPRHHPSVMTLLPPPLRQRGVQPIGRLDEDTTGLLLFTDDGTLIHRLTSPKWHVPKVYRVQCEHPVDAAQIERLCAGVVLEDDPRPAVALAAERPSGIQDPRVIDLTLSEGRYHQVKRMMAAVGNRVETLHRWRFGALDLPADLPVGGWRWVDRAAVQPAASVTPHG